VFADRLAVWTARLCAPDSRGETCTVVAHVGAEIVGFAHVVFDHDPEWGALLDNLHVTHDLKGLGVGTKLMAEVARAVLNRSRPTTLYLYVLEQNVAGQAFYNARGGQSMERVSRDPDPGYRLRYWWSDPAVLL
jgi:ribosomal protein S18 acetylase RimI-like enzyme